MSSQSLARRGAPVILPIQYLRGIAAMLVVWEHARIQVRGMPALLPGHFGTSGVDLFFVISGFIMVVTTAGSTITPWQFMWRRIVRIVPLYWALTLVMVAAAWVAPALFKTLAVAPATLLQSLLFIPHFSQSFPGRVWPLLVVGWTLNVEMFFYALFALSLLLPARGRQAALTVSLVVLVAVGQALGPAVTSAAALTYTHPILLEFAAGTLIARLWLAGSIRLPSGVSVVLVGLGFALLMLHVGTGPQRLGPIVGASLAVVGALDPRFADRANALLLKLGDSSYSLYLSHIFTLGALRVLWTTLVPGEASAVTAAAFMLAALAACALAGWFVFRWVERPLLGLWHRSRAPTPGRELVEPQIR